MSVNVRCLVPLSPGCCPLDIEHITISSVEIIGELLMPILNSSATSLRRCLVAAENEPRTNAISWILFYLSSISEKIFDPEHFILC